MSEVEMILPEKPSFTPNADIHEMLSDIPRKDSVKGYWIKDDPEINCWRCSLCGENALIIDGTPSENHMHYCWCCGAKMEGEKFYDESQDD